MDAYKITLEANFSLSEKQMRKWKKKTKAYFNSESLEDLNFWFLYNEDFIKFMKDSSMFTIHKTKIENQGTLVRYGSGFVGEKQLAKNLDK
jgi:hypothetical protein